MKILVTGGLGHLGSNFIRNISIPCDIMVVDNLLTQRFCSLFNLKQSITFHDKSFIEISNNDLKDVDIIIHFAAIADAVQSLYDKELVKQTNIDDTLEFIEKVKNSNVKLFIFPSTTSIYGGSSNIMYENDESNIKPQSPYAESKIMVERYLKKSLVSHVVLRFGTIFGFSQGMRFHTAINKFCYQAALGKSLSIWKSHVDLVRPYLGINDCLRAIELVINNNTMWNQTYNVVTANYSLKEVICCIKKVKDVDLQLCDSPICGEFSYQTSIDKIKNFGFIPCDNLEIEISKMLQILSGIIK